MIIDLVDRLVDRIIQLATYHRDARRNLFDTFAVPIFTLFDEVHTEYLTSFRQYREIMKSSPDFSSIVDDLCDTIETDNLFTASQRDKLWALTKLPDMGEFEELIGTIGYYLHGRDQDIHGSPEALLQEGQMWRTGLLEELRNLKTGQQGMIRWDTFQVPSEVLEQGPEQTKKFLAVEHLDALVRKMQGTYALATQRYFALKQKCLQ